MKATAYFSSLLLLVAATASCQQAQQTNPAWPAFIPVFSPADCFAVVQYWAQPGRFEVMPPSDASKFGLFRPHLSVKGSTWLLNYERLSRQVAPPTQNGISDSDTNQDWNKWIQSKFAYDYAQAAKLCEKYNAMANCPTNLAGINLNAVAPGACPVGLAALAGDPPALADAASIKEYVIHFDDVDLTYEDHVGVPPQYAYYRFDEGINSEGAPVKDIPTDRIDRLFQMAGVSKSVENAFNAVSALEGGFDAVNTYDTGYVSVGFIQFASLKEGAGSLGAMLLQYKTDDPTDFTKDFHQYGIDVTPAGVMSVVDPITGVELQGENANMEVIQEPRLLAVFQRAGLKSDAFDSEQIKSAIIQFYPANDVITFTMPDNTQASVKVGDIIHSEAGMATLTDRKVNTGKLRGLDSVLSEVASEHKITSPLQLSNYELEIIQKMRYRKDYLKDSHLTQPTIPKLSDGSYSGSQP